MQTVNIHHAKTHLSQLVEAVSHGEEIIIARAGKPAAKLVPISSAPVKRKPGRLKNKIGEIPDDFDAPLSDDILNYFQGEE
jgi:prevent-host-death family protein